MAVCLHCLHEARVAARERRQRIILRTGVWILSISVVGIVGAAGVNAAVRHPAPPPAPLRHARRAPAKSPSAQLDSAPTAVAMAAPVIQQGAPAPVSAAMDTASHTAAAPTPVTPPKVVVDSVRPVAPTALGPIVASGRTDLRDSIYTERTGDTIVVHFDTSPLRTRRADKFEMVVRQTLPSVYGAPADSALAAVAAGTLASPNELLTTLPRKGIHLSAPKGNRLVLWPETRPGRDGPLVVAYRVTIER